MREKLFKEIGELSIKEDNCSEEEINRIYSLVMKKKRYEKKAIIRKKIKVSMISFATVASIAFVCVYSIKIVSMKSNVENEVVMHTTDESVIVEQNDRVVVSVYAAKDKNQVVTENYAKELTVKKVKSGEKINIGTYNLLSSSVPGYPLLVNDEKKKNSGNDIKIKIETDGGSLLTWNPKTGNVKDKGKNAKFSLEENIYWSPLDNGKFSEKANLKIVMYEDDKIIGETLLYIYEEQEASYAIEKIK